LVIFFDIDETLLDQRKAEAAAAVNFLNRYGHWLNRPYALPEFCALWRALREKHVGSFFRREVPLEETRRRRVRELFGSPVRGFSDAEIDAVFAVFEDRYRGAWAPFDDVIPALELLRGHTCGVISNGSAAQQKLKLERTGLARYFQIVVISEETGAAKPAEAIFRAACAAAGALPADCIHVGDRLDHDALAGRAAGLQTFWLNRRGAPHPAEVDVVHSLFDFCRRLEIRVAV
jgi:putative hydrolase of the HAD superfamily